MSVHDGGAFLEANRQAFRVAKSRQVGIPYRINPLSQFTRNVEGGAGGFGLLQDTRKMSRTRELRGALSYYDRHPFVETDKHLLVRDLLVNTFGPFGSEFSVKQHEVVFEYRGVEVLRRGEGGEAALREAAAAAVAVRVRESDDRDERRRRSIDGRLDKRRKRKEKEEEAKKRRRRRRRTTTTTTTTIRDSDEDSDTVDDRSPWLGAERGPTVFVRGRHNDKRGFKERDRLWQRLAVDYGIPDRGKSPHRALVTCVSLSSLKRRIKNYAEAAMRLRENAPATDDATRTTPWRFQKELVERNSCKAADGGEYSFAGTEALFALVESTTDLYDLVRPLGTCHNGELEVRGHPDKKRDLLQVLIGGEGRLRLPDNGEYERDDDASIAMCTDAWLVYRQKTIRYRDDGRRRLPPGGDPSLDSYPDVDLFLTNKPRTQFVEDFLGKERFASHPVRGRPREPAPIVFVFLGTLVENTYGRMGGRQVVQYHSGLAMHQHHPRVFYPQFLKKPTS